MFFEKSCLIPDISCQPFNRARGQYFRRREIGRRALAWPIGHAVTKMVTPAPLFFLKNRKFQNWTENEIQASNSFLLAQNILKTLFSPKKQIYIEAKHTKDSKDLACSTLSLCLLSRAFLLENLRWVRGSRFTEEKSKLAEIEIFRKKIFSFFLEIFSMCFGHAVTKNDFGHASARRPAK